MKYLLSRSSPIFPVKKRKPSIKHFQPQSLSPIPFSNGGIFSFLLKVNNSSHFVMSSLFFYRNFKPLPTRTTAIPKGSKNPAYPKKDHNKIYLEAVEYSMVPKLSPYISQLEANRRVKRELIFLWNKVKLPEGILKSEGGSLNET